MKKLLLTGVAALLLQPGQRRPRICRRSETVQAEQSVLQLNLETRLFSATHADGLPVQRLQIVKAPPSFVIAQVAQRVRRVDDEKAIPSRCRLCQVKHNLMSS